MPTLPESSITVSNLLAAFENHAAQYYRHRDGSPTLESRNLMDAAKPLRAMYGDHPVDSFGPMDLREIRESMIRDGLARTTINYRIRKIRYMFKWGVSWGMVPVAVHQGLTCLNGLQAGRSEAKEPKGIHPVSIDVVEAAIPFMPDAVAAMVRFQLLTGCRVSEMFKMRGRDLVMDAPDVWEYRPGHHKNSWRGQDRIVMIGPKAIEVIKPFLSDDPEAYLFQPRSEVPAKLREVGDFYNRRSYRWAIVRACRRAGVEVWTPLQLRHTRADQIAQAFGIEAGAAVLGHASVDTTQIYLSRNVEQARKVMASIG